MSALPKIPSPASHHWREFRHKWMPVLVFMGVLTLSVNLWNSHVAPPSIVGEVETVRSSVATTVRGEIVDLKVDLLAEVTNGTPIAIVNVMDDDTVRATMKVNEADLTVMAERMRQNDLRNLTDYETMKQNLLMRKVDRAIANAELQFAVSDFQRIATLLTNSVASQAEYDLARSKKEALQEKVNELDKLIIGIGESLVRLRQPENLLNRTNVSDAVARAIEAKLQEVIEQAKPQVIKAPMDGVVSVILKRKGEKVVRGDAILVISTKTSERIVGYVRQPLNVLPQVGDSVEVRSRKFNRPMSSAKVLKVGTQLEPIDPHILPLMTQGQEYGLPLLITLPKELKLMPGETVDISMVNNK